MFTPQPKPVKSEKKTKNRIKPVSEKRQGENELYKHLSSVFKKEHKTCSVCKSKQTDDIHHMKGRTGFADEWAKWMGVSLFLDIRYWLAVCRICHTRIECNPEWAKEKGYSVGRI